LPHVFFAVFEHAIDQKSQLVGRGGDGAFATETALDAPVEQAQIHRLVSDAGLPVSAGLTLGNQAALQDA
jgi:hypothetical protein